MVEPMEQVYAYVLNAQGEPGPWTGAEPREGEQALLAACGVGAYLVQMVDDARGLLFQHAFVHAESDDEIDRLVAVFGWNRTEAQAWADATAVADRLKACGFGRVLAGRGTGPYGRHEVAAFVPLAGLTPEQAQMWEQQFYACLPGRPARVA